MSIIKFEPEKTNAWKNAGKLNAKLHDIYESDKYKFVDGVFKIIAHGENGDDSLEMVMKGDDYDKETGNPYAYFRLNFDGKVEEFKIEGVYLKVTPIIQSN